MAPLLTHDRELMTGTVVDRPNRFVVRVDFGSGPERAFLGDPGALEGIVEPGRELLASAVEDVDRATDYDAIAVRTDGVWVSVRAALANDLFAAALESGAVPAFEGYTIDRAEPPLPKHGRTDFRLDSPSGGVAYVEVKSATHVEDRVAKFPDRQTERGRRHLRSLRTLQEDGIETHVVFVVQRPDVDVLRPYRAVDPDFAALLRTVRTAGVGIHACSVEFQPSEYRLVRPSLPVDLTYEE